MHRFYTGACQRQKPPLQPARVALMQPVLRMSNSKAGRSPAEEAMSITADTPVFGVERQTAAAILARLDRLPATRHIWVMVTLLSLGGMFESMTCS